jgi:hypothetical protein
LDLSVPGGIGAGTYYQNGTLEALRQGVLQTDIYVYPDGYNPSTPGMHWLYTTATNRIEKSVELVILYYRDRPYGRLGVFDWSCSPNDPCENGETDPSWIWTVYLWNFRCNIGEFVDPGGHLQKVMRYSNESRILRDGVPPRWENAVYLWNFCEAAWDRIYRHRYRAAQRNCSDGWYTCAWWGPILETFPNGVDPTPEINELGFANTTLLHDGTLSQLRSDETRFSSPIRPWRIFHLQPYNSWAVGNRVIPTSRVNHLVRFRPRESSQRYVPRSSACPVGYAGEFAFTARLKNVSDKPLSNLIVEIDQLAQQDLVIDRGTYVGANQWFEVPRKRQYRDGILMPSETAAVPFRICIAEPEPFSIRVNVRRR